jgi:polyvinyl alcohol dehydrogenase (cytochrome)
VLDYACCTADGSVSALDANTGKRIWKTYSIAQRPRPTHKNSQGVQQWAPAGVPIWNTPTIDPSHHAVYVGTGDASTYPAPATTDAILALDLNTGKRLWSHQVYAGDSFIVGCAGAGKTENCPKQLGPDWDVPMSPMVTHLPDGRTLLVFAMKPGDVLALDADKKGEVAWRNDHKRANAAPQSASGAAMRNRGPLWGGAMDEHFAYVPCSGTGIAAVSLADGKNQWCAPLDTATDPKVGYSAAVTVIPGVLFAGGSDGSVWALSTDDGHTLWKYKTAIDFKTVNAVPAHGGSIVSAGATVAGGMLFVGSGYGVVSETPGNVLLAFGVQ